MYDFHPSMFIIPYLGLSLIVFIFGITVGSFLNVCILRLPKGESLTKSSSHCMSCGNKILKRDLVPLFSWLFLKGKCRYCGEKISARYPIVEALNGVLWVLAFFRYDFMTLKPLFLSLFLSCLVVVAFMDWDTQLINTGVVVFTALVGLGSFFCGGISLESAIDRLLGAAVISIPFLLIALISKERALGYGDVMLMAAGGLYLGFKSTIVAGIIGIIVAAAAGLIIKYKSKTSVFAFGPWLCIGLAIAGFYGNQIADMYLNLLKFN